MRKLISSLLLISVMAVAALADQAAYITKKQAEKAAAFLKDKPQIRHYCALCEDKDDRVEDVASVEASKTGFEDYWQVKVNGKGIDLAYVYFKSKDGKWKNIAKELNIEVHGVPEHLP